jgi:hypothetical protein
LCRRRHHYKKPAFKIRHLRCGYYPDPTHIVFLRAYIHDTTVSRISQRLRTHTSRQTKVLYPCISLSFPDANDGRSKLYNPFSFDPYDAFMGNSKRLQGANTRHNINIMVKSLVF